MSDLIDRASIEEQVGLDVILLNSRSKQEEIKRSGFCANCGGAIDAGVFCDADCSFDFEKRKQAKMRGGK